MANVLIVYAHPEPASFNAALKDRAVEALRAAGHGVVVSDLYAEGFDPVAGRHDFTTVADASRFHYQKEQAHAAREGGYAADIAREQARVRDADVLILQYPMWWGGPPAIVKGWCDRVLSYGFAYVDGTRFDTGLFRGRRAMLSITTGGTVERFSDAGVYGEMHRVIYQVQRLTLQYLGYTVEEPFVAYAAPRVEPAERATYLEALAARVTALAAMPIDRKDLPAPQSASEGAWAAKR